MAGKSKNRRAAKALAIVLMPFVVLALWSQVAGEESTVADDVPGLSGREFASDVLDWAWNDGGQGGSLPRVMRAYTARVIPGWFAEEVFSPDDAHDLMANEDWSVAGFSLDSSADETLRDLTSQLEQRGWIVVESGIDGVVTGVKKGGRCQWVWLGCTPIGKSTSVVVQVSSDA